MLLEEWRACARACFAHARDFIRMGTLDECVRACVRGKERERETERVYVFVCGVCVCVYACEKEKEGDRAG